MTPEPTEAQIKEACEKANALIRAIVPPNVLTKISVDPKTSYIDDAFVRLVMEHEAFRQQVSEAFCEVVAIAERVNGYQSARTVIKSLAAPFIQPDPTPTPEQVLAEAIKACGIWDSGETLNTRLIGALAKRGYHVAPLKDTRHD